MSKFKIKTIQEKKEQSLIKKIQEKNISDNINNIFDENAPATRSFSIPLNDFEISLLQIIAKEEDRSMRKISRRIFVKALKEFKFNSN